ncbi:hypothetical protein RM549_18415 [Salegentibacter sp. F188]|jgi:hypothetical protein|uniref:Uncharacterized protein n=1 Tax=Autumnicola patrickiae TaxID=3075591 RepID=A0ABU3E713_9FLAO|nr:MULTISPECIES: hypothetical protein [Flavobacteriaceae]MDT0691773.1 hypothetical protein [Salegentibacter sp. F188]|tara:strand:+ start:944 stop:1099 length:156 start_codon:yes stop_codon:yes gene_type:complete
MSLNRRIRRREKRSKSKITKRDKLWAIMALIGIFIAALLLFHFFIKDLVYG